MEEMSKSRYGEGTQSLQALRTPYQIFTCSPTQKLALGLLDPKEGWVLKKWCFPIVVLEKTLENPLDSQEIKPVNPKGNQPWMLIGRTGDVWSWIYYSLATWCKEPTHWKRPWCQERVRAGGEGGGAEYEIDIITDAMDVNLSKLWETVKDKSLTCCSSWGPKELDTT